MFSAFPIETKDAIINDVFLPQLLQEAGDDIPSVCTADSISVAAVLVSLFTDVYKVDQVFSYCGR